MGKKREEPEEPEELEELEVFSEHEFELILLNACSERASLLEFKPSTIRECERLFLDVLMELVDDLYMFNTEKWRATLVQPSFYMSGCLMMVRDIALKMFAEPDPYGK